MIVGGILVIAGAWLTITGLLAHREMTAVNDEVGRLHTQILAGQTAQAQVTVGLLGQHAGRANHLTRGPAWALAARIPVVGAPLRTVRGITTGAHVLATTALPALVTVSTQLDPATLREPGGRIDLARLSAVTPALGTSLAAVNTVSAMIDRLPRHTWLAPADRAEHSLTTQLSTLSATLHSAGLATQIAPGMLGEHGTKRYFVAIQNEAEARGTGGLPGAFAILRADDGRLTIERFESDSTLTGTSASVDFGADYQQLYAGAGTTTMYGNANLSPNFPYAAKIWASMWQNYSGERVDGTVAVDPTALSYLLAVTGPATLPDGTQVTASNIVEMTQSTVYARFAPAKGASVSATTAANKERRLYLLDIARAVSAKVLAGGSNTKALLAGTARAADEGRLLIWSAEPALEAKLAPTSMSGVIPETTAPYVGLSIVNDAGNKLDYYLGRSLTWERSGGCASSRTVTVTVKLTNAAPPRLPGYVIGRQDRHGYPVQPGDNRLLVSYLATEGALMHSVTVNGAPMTATIGLERGHPVYTVDLEIPRATTRTIVLHLTEPAAAGTPIVLRQPLVRPLSVELEDASCR